MNGQNDPGLFFDLDELKVLFSSLKPHEDSLSPRAELLLAKIEKILYNHLSIREIGALSLPEGE